MTVGISRDVFNDEHNSNSLDKLWHVIEDQHKLFLNDDDDIDAVMTSEWYKGLRENIQDIIKDLIVWALGFPSSTKADIIVATEQNIQYFSIKEAIVYLRQPFVVILENSNNDASFFDALLNNFKEGQTLALRKRSNLFKYGMGGGSTIPDFIKNELRAFEGEMFTKEQYKYLRCFVLMDSDREFPNMPLKTDKQNLIAFLESNDIKYHVLTKREMENYLPDEVYEEIENNREYVEAYLRLTPIQKDYFDLQKGFDRNTNFEKLHGEIKELFNNISENDKKTFRAGNLSRINTDDKENFKTEFPKLFLSKKVTKNTLLKRCAHHSKDSKDVPYDPDELPNLLNKITQLL